MTQRNAYYQVMYGLPGCLPNSHDFYLWQTRGDMVRGIDSLLDWYGYPARARRQVNLVEIWRYIQTGGKRGHFVIRGQQGNACNLEFVQISAQEYAAQSEESEYV